MRIKEGYMMRQVAGHYVVVPVGAAALDFNGMINLNETGAVLWNAMLEDADEEKMVSALLADYDISEEIARNDVKQFIIKMREANLVDE